MSVFSPRIVQSRRTEDFFSYAVVSGPLIITVEYNYWLPLDQQSTTIHAVSAYIQSNVIKDFQTFTIWAERFLTTCVLPLDSSFAIGYVFGDALFLHTKGTAQIFLHRNGNTTLLLSGDRNASGFVKANDHFAFVSGLVLQALGKDKIFTYLAAIPSQNDIEEYLVNNQIQGSAVLAYFSTSLSTPQKVIPRIEESVLEETIKEEKPLPQERKTILSSLPIQKKRLALVVLLILVGILLVWSIGSGHQRRTAKEEIAKITIAKQSIDALLQKSLAELGSNPQQASQDLEGAKQQLQILEISLLYEKQNTLMTDIRQVIAETEKQILKKTEKAAAEFIDIALESQNAKPVSLTVADGMMGVLDANGTTVYVISLSSKSIEKKIITPISPRQKLLLSKKNIYLFDKSKGLWKVVDGKNTAMVAGATEWDNIVDGALYNGNLYLLDKGALNIYKYSSAADEVVATATAYLSKADALAQGVSMAIDGSIYIALPQKVLKYTSGAGQDFPFTLPGDTSSQLTKVLADKDTPNLVLWDKQKNLIYLVKKDGAFQQQFSAAVLRDAADIALYQSQLFVLSGTKVYSIALESL